MSISVANNIPDLRGQIAEILQKPPAPDEIPYQPFRPEDRTYHQLKAIYPHLTKLKELASNEQMEQIFRETLAPIFNEETSFLNQILQIFSDCLLDSEQPWKDLRYMLSLHAINEKIPLYSSTTPEEKQLLSLLKVQPGKNSAAHRSLVSYLRTIPESPLIRDISYLRFTEVHPFDFCHILIKAFLEEGYAILIKQDPSNLHLLNTDPFKVDLETQIEAIHQVPQKFKAPLLNLFIGRLSGGTNLNFNPQLYNIPYVYGTLKITSNLIPPEWVSTIYLQILPTTEQTIKIIRTGTPTHQGEELSSLFIGTTPQINLEFSYFVKTAKERGERVLFVSLQDSVGRWFADESKRFQVLKELSNEYKEHFILISLSNDSAFYNQTGEYENKDNKIQFLETYAELILQSESGYDIPDAWRESPDYKKDLSSLLTIASALMFDDVESLTREERIDFITFFQSGYPLYLCCILAISHLIICCKDSIDRANIALLILMMTVLIMINEEESEEMMETLYTLLHAATVMIKKRELNSRKTRLFQILERLKDKKIRQNLKVLAKKIGFDKSKIEVKRELNQQLAHLASLLNPPSNLPSQQK